MNILVVNETYAPHGGLERYLLSVLNALEEAGHTISVISLAEQQQISLPHRKEYFFPDLTMKSYIQSLPYARQIDRILKRVNPDIIHFHMVQHFLNPWLLQRFLRYGPTVWTIHWVRLFCPFSLKMMMNSGTTCNLKFGLHCLGKCAAYIDKSYSWKYLFHKYLELKLAHRVDRLIVASRYLKDQLLFNGFPDESICRLPLFADEIDLSSTTELNEVLWVGRMDGTKGLPDLLMAINRIPENNFRLICVGDGAFYPWIQEKAKRLGLQDRVRLVGPIYSEKIHEYYQRCALVVFPSLAAEGFGLIGIEAMACAKPVVAYESGGITEWLENGHTGYLVPPGDIDRLAKKIRILLNNRDLAKKMGKNGLKRFKQRFTKDLHIKRLVALYRQVIEENSREGRKR